MKRHLRISLCPAFPPGFADPLSTVPSREDIRRILRSSSASSPFTRSGREGLALDNELPALDVVCTAGASLVRPDQSGGTFADALLAAQQHSVGFAEHAGKYGGTFADALLAAQQHSVGFADCAGKYGGTFADALLAAQQHSVGFADCAG
jgi:hypothetical protein